MGVTADYGLVKINNGGAVNGRPLKKVWKNCASNYGIPEKNKRLYKFTIETDYQIKVIIECDGENFYYILNKYDNELNLDIRGENFGLNIISETSNAKIVAPTLYFSYLKERL